MTAEREPNELNELEALLKEFITRYTHVENEIDQLKEELKTVIEDYEDRLDVKTLKQAIRIVKAKRKVDKVDTFEKYEHILDQMEEI